MQDSIISWTNKSWNPVHGCSRVSEGCRFCYAETLSLKYGWTKTPWTGANAGENVLLKPHKLNEPYSVKSAVRIFVNSMSDLFHEQIPDWYRTVIFCVMLDVDRHIYQILTKRPLAALDWEERFAAAQQRAEFRQAAQETKKSWGARALNGEFGSPWASHVWIGTSVEDSRVLHRIETLRQVPAMVRFVSAEPLLGPLGALDLAGIHWMIVGGESGGHMKEHPERWMQQEWAREIRDACVEQDTAFFYKQDSGHVTELRPYLVEADGSKWTWQQFPFDRTPAVNVDTGEVWPEGVSQEMTTTPPKPAAEPNIQQLPLFGH